MKQLAVFSSTKGFPSSHSIINQMLKTKSSNKIETYLVRLNRSYEKHMSKLNLRLSK